MDTNSSQEKDCGLLGSLFQTVINDMRGSTPLWEEFTYKSMKLHSTLKTTVVAIGAFLEAFQKVADMATSSKGATREIGSALTRLCLRHRSIESHLKVLTSSIVDNLVAPLQEKLEDWKKSVAQIDKEHAKEYKKAKQEIKKVASDTMRLQKKVRKGSSTQGKSELQQKLDSAMVEVNSKYQHLEETEKNSLRSALIEERSRFCHFITCLKPFVDNEVKLLTEISHINEIMDSLCMQASEPSELPASSEQIIVDLKGLDHSAWNPNQQGSPPSSPSSLGSRKSSMCSINSINSASSSGSSKSHSPSHTMHKRTTSQPPPGAIRLTSVSSQDSGFTSQDTLFLRPNTPQSLSLYQTSATTQERDEADCDSTPTTPSDNTPSASSTWNNWPNSPGHSRSDPMRPHTISSAYEKGHTRPALKPDMFQPPQAPLVEMRPKPVRSVSQSGSQNRPSATISKLQPVLPPHCPKPKVKVVAPPMLPPEIQPIYANTEELRYKPGRRDISPDDGEPKTPTTPANNPIAQIQQNTSTSLELAKAIRELEASTAALNSAYDTDNYMSTTAHNTSAAPNNAAACDSDSYTSKSSGYGTMASTPAGSEDTIASGDCSMTPAADTVESDKYSTIPRSADANIAYREAICSQRPASSTGIPVSGANILRRGNSINTPKPPPPVRRTASVTGAPIHVVKMRGSPPRKTSAGGVEDAMDGDQRMIEGAYAELQLIQQSIHAQPGGMKPATAIKPSQRPPSANNSRNAVAPGSAQPQESAANVMQSLNAQFANLNSQYQDGMVLTESGDYSRDGELTKPGAASRGQKPAPPAVMQKPVKSGIPPPPSVISAQHQQYYNPHQHPHRGPHSHPGQIPIGSGHFPLDHRHSTHSHPHQQQQQQQHSQNNNPRPIQHGKSWHGHPSSRSHNPQVQHQQSHYSDANVRQQMQQSHMPVPSKVEDFPLPPTAEEIQEMEKIYSRPPTIHMGPTVQAPPAGPKVQQKRQLPQKQPPQQQLSHPNDVQASLLSELKRRVSVEDSSNA